MIALRSESEIDILRAAGSIVARVLDKLKSEAAAGVSTLELDRCARDEILKNKGYPAFKDYKGFPGNICASLNETIVHGIPSERRLKNGDLIKLDVGVKYKDYFADGAITVGIGNISAEAKRLTAVTKEALLIGIEMAVPPNRLSDISHAIQSFVEENGFNVVRAFVGHGIGRKLHEEPEIPNYGKPDRGPRLESGMILAIEPMVNAGTFEAEVLKDGWTAVTKDRMLSAHFEHTIVIRDGAAEILTRI